ncbi:MAG TPA: magnesium-translocating P-type ATPase [Methanomicrobiales archaeon]|nr:magnesium-translocating P-type ATPase [Methanomicrobiales archaeon]
MASGDALAMLHATSDGLSTEEAEERRREYGPNEVPGKRKRGVATEFLSHFRNPLVVILLIAGGISVIVGDATDAAIIFTIVLVSVVIDFFQEYRAQGAVALLRQRIVTTATVLRDGAKHEVPLADLVPGDIIFLSAGDLVPADAVVLSARDFFVNQSVLTGEPFPVERYPVSAPPADTGAAAVNRIFLGTSVVSGTATAVIERTGGATQYGKIAWKISARPPETEMERGLKRFGFLVMQLVFFLVIFVFLVNALYRHSVLESLLFAVALAVGVTPELLPMILSLNLSRGAIAMSGKGVIVKHLASIQNLGSMDILCTDKTGTLTENRITLIRHVDGRGEDSEKVLLFSFLNSSHQTGLKSPLDDAILAHRAIDIGRFRKVDEIPFDFVRKRVSIVVEENGNRLLIAKGAPEEVLRVCTSLELGDLAREMTDEDRDQVLGLYCDLSGEGFRTLAVAYRPIGDRRTVYGASDEEEMVFLGYVAFIDPPKESAKESLAILNRAGVELKILTGDNDLVTRKTCDLLGYKIGRIVTGPEIATLDDDALARVVEGANIFTRVTPDQKDRIILALKRNNHVIGYLGDGINDAPSLRTADIGISVDNAVDIARESSDIILLKKDLRVIEEGVLEGRRTFGNTMKYIMMGTSSNFGNMASVAAASLFLPFLPMLPVQILLNNLLYDLSQSAIPTDNVDPEYVEKPKRLDIGFIKRFVLVFGPISSLFDILTFAILILVFSATEHLFQTAWFIESLCTQVAIIFVIRTRRSPFTRSLPSSLLVLGCFLVMGAAFLLPYSPLGPAFGFVQLPVSFYLVLAALIAGYLALVEVVKRWFYGSG